jgi:hypothetical protein
MPTNKVEPAVLETAAVGEVKAKRVRKPAAANPPTEGAPTPTKKAPAKKAPRHKGSAAQPEAPAPTVQKTDTGLHASFSMEDISVRAYFIGEHRRSLGLGGDSEGDWLEAERQLKSEALGIAASLRHK